MGNHIINTLDNFGYNIQVTVDIILLLSAIFLVYALSK